MDFCIQSLLNSEAKQFQKCSLIKTNYGCIWLSKKEIYLNLTVSNWKVLWRQVALKQMLLQEIRVEDAAHLFAKSHFFPDFWSRSIRSEFLRNFLDITKWNFHMDACRHAYSIINYDASPALRKVFFRLQNSDFLWYFEGIRIIA